MPRTCTERAIEIKPKNRPSGPGWGQVVIGLAVATIVAAAPVAHVSPVPTTWPTTACVTVRL